jgi:cytochrome c553
MTTKLDEMWAAFEAHKPTPAYAEAWQRMCKERTIGAAMMAEGAAMLAEDDNAEVAAYLAANSLRSFRDADDWALRAIDAIKEVKP